MNASWRLNQTVGLFYLIIQNNQQLLFIYFPTITKTITNYYSIVIVNFIYETIVPSLNKIITEFKIRFFFKFNFFVVKNFASIIIIIIIIYWY